MTAPKILSLPVAAIRTDGGTQTRVELNEATVERYAEDERDGCQFPPISVFQEGRNTYWLSKGFHRLAAKRRNGDKYVFAEVYPGTARDALQFALGDNSKHALPRSREDLRHEIGLVLRDAEWSKKSDSEIATMCGTTHKTVASVRAELSWEIPRMRCDRREVTRNGVEYLMDVSGIRDAAVLREALAANERKPTEPKPPQAQTTWRTCPQCRGKGKIRAQ